MNMNKLIIKEIGYDFNSDNIENFKKLSARDRLNKIFILANYSQLDFMRKSLAESVGGVSIDNIITFDDLVNKFKDPSKNYITREEGAWIIKKILEAEEYSYSSSLGTAKEILNYLLDIKSFEITSDLYKAKTNADLDLKNLANIYKAYEDFLEDNSLEDDIGLYLDGIKNLKQTSRLTGRDIVINGFIEFRRHELSLIKELMDLENNLTIQYPFYSKRPNKKFEKIKKDLLGLSFILDEDFKFSEENMAPDIFSDEEKTYDIETLVIPSANKLDEVKEILSYIKKDLNDVPIEDMVIIIPEDYENILKALAKEEKLPLNIMNQENIRSLPLIKSVLNFLYLVKNDEKKKLISCFYDENLKFKNYLDQDIDDSEFIRALRELDYRGLYYNYSNISLDLNKFLAVIKNQIDDFKDKPIEYLRNNFCQESLKAEAISDFMKNKDQLILEEYIKALEALEKILDKVENFKSIVGLSFDDSLDILINYLEEEKYYSANKKQGIQVLKPVNSIGIKAPYKIICGLNFNKPNVTSKGYLYSDKFKSFHESLNFKIEDSYEAYDNNILLFAQTVSFAKNLVFSYVYPDIEARDSRSVFLTDSLKRINENFLLDYSKKDLADLSFTLNQDDFNYLSKDQVAYINRLTDLYIQRKDFSPKLNGFVEAVKDKNLYYHRAEYSPKMLGYYNDCPFKYYMAYILKYENLDLDYRDSFFIDKGNVYHKVLEIFFKYDDYKNLSDEEIEERLINIIDDPSFEESLEIDLKAYQKEIYKNYLLAYIKKDLANQESFLSDFRARSFEKNIKGSSKDIKITGKLDRVDYDSDDNYIIYDYKSRSIPTKNAFAELKNIQLSLYGLILGKDKLAGISYGSIEGPRLANFLFKKDYFKKGQDDEEIEDYFTRLESSVEEIDKKIQEGDFMLKPIDEKACQLCPYQLICRKEDLNINEV